MPLFLQEDDKKLTKKQIIVPQKLVDKLTLNKNLFDKYKKTKGFKRVSAIVDTDYNKRSDNKDKIHTDDKTISFGDLKRIDYDMRHTTPNPNNIEYVLPGGEDMKNWAHDTLRSLRTAVKKVPQVPEVPKLEKDPTKPRTQVKNIKMGSANIQLKENIDYFYENFYDEYDANYVFNSFLENPNGKQNWGPLINPEMYAKALREFTKFGELTNFPSKYVYQWMGIIMKNTSILIANTDICGHGRNFPSDEYEDFLRSYYNDERYIEVSDTKTTIEVTPEEVINMCEESSIRIDEATDKYGQTYFPWVTQQQADSIANQQDVQRQRKAFEEEYGNIEKYIEAYNEKFDNTFQNKSLTIDYNTNKILWKIDAFDLLDYIGVTGEWMTMPDGSDAISDYGIEPIMKIISEYDDNLPPEKVLVLVNKALDVYHQRGDMSSIFIQGGSKVLSKISEEINKENGKKIIVNENQLLALKEYHDQQVFNFDDDGYAYFEKNNWEHYVDFLEDIGKYGMLPASEWTRGDIENKIEQVKKEVNYQSDDIYEDDYKEAFLSLVCETFVYEHYDKNDIFEEWFLDLFNDYEEFKANNNYYDECNTLRNFIEQTTDVLDDPNNLDNYLTYFGNSKFQENLREDFADKFDDYDMLDGMIINDRGLVYIERNIKIPYFNSPDFNYDHNKDYYNYLKKMYYDIGYCFSWGEGHGEAYCGHSFGGKTSEIKLKCWVDPKDINWEETVYKNCYSLREEREVYISASGAKIEVFDVVIENGGEVNGVYVSGKSLLKKPIIIEY